MPSVLIGNPLASGPQIIVSGNPWSGRVVPQGGIQFRLAREASGNVYLGWSGNITLNSGGMFLSGGGLADGMQIGPGDAYFVPRIAFETSGALNVYARHDAAVSGQGRLYYDVY